MAIRTRSLASLTWIAIAPVAACHWPWPDVDHVTRTDAAFGDTSTLDAADVGLLDAATDAATDTATDAVPDTGPDLAFCAPDASLDFCAAIPALPGLPAIDDHPDACPELPPLRPLPLPVQTVGPTAPFPYDAQYAVGWNAQGLYIKVRIGASEAQRVPPLAGELTYCGDSVELYVDSDGVFPLAPIYDAAGTRQFVVASPPAGTTLPYRFATVSAHLSPPTGETTEIGMWTGAFAMYSTPTYYDLVADIQAADLGLSVWTLVPGQRIGLDIAVDVGAADAADAGSRCPRRSQYVFHLTAGCDMPYTDDSCFCAPVLAAP